MRRVLNNLPLSGVAVLIAAFPVAAMANLSGTPTLTANAALSLDTGTTSASGGDILWSGTAMTPQSSATAYNIGNLGAAGFGVMTQSTLSSFSAVYSKSAIPASTLAVGDVFAVHTNGGNYAAVLVTAASGTSITLQFTTFGVNSGPSITAVANNYGGIPPGFSNSGIAQGAIFYITGTGLADPKAVAVLQNSVGANLPTTLNGASVKVTVGGTTVTPVFYYAISVALGLVLPSNTPLGTGQVTVTYNNQTSPAYTIQVVASAPGILTVNQAGTGLGFSATGVGVPYTYTNPIPPNTTVVLVGSGLGADPKAPQRDVTYVGVTSVSADSINAIAHFYVGGMDVGAPAYQGSFGFPGLNQINLTIPANAPTGCNVSVVGVTAAGIPTNSFTLPIGNGSCSDPTFGITGTQLQNLSGQTTVKTGSVGLIQLTGPAITGGGTTVTSLASATFQSYTGSTYGSASGSVSVGGCIVNEYVNSSASTGTSTGLDAGTITVSGPAPDAAVALTTNSALVGSYYAMLSAGYIPNTGGTFTFKGTGGANVGSFTANVVFPNPVLTWTNAAAAASIARSAGLPVTWTGGGSGTYVIIAGSSASSTAAFGSFTCIVPLSAGQFTVPSYVLNSLPAGTGSVIVENATNFQSFSASGLDFALAYGFVGSSVSATYN